MASYLLDTNVVSELYRPAPSASVEAWFAKREARDLFISVVTIGELTRGIHRLPDCKRRDTLQQWLDNDVSRQFLGRILPFEQTTAVIWGRLMGEGLRIGKSRSSIDAQIAATAIHHDLELVTRNTSDFSDLDQTVVNPWLD